MSRGDRHQFIHTGGQWRLCTALELRQSDSEEAWLRLDITRRLSDWCADPCIWPVLLGFYEKLSGCSVRQPPGQNDRIQIEHYLRQMFEQRRAFAISPPVPKGEVSSSLLEEVLEEVGDDQPRGLAQPQSFVEFVLLDELGKPVAGEAFEIRLPNGRVETGTFDAKGKVRFDGIPEGECQIKFLDRDRRDFL